MNKIHILVVDDNYADYNLIKRKLQSAFPLQHEVSFDHAEDFESCVRFLQEKKCSCILLDYLLGAENGIKVLRKIRERYENIPIVFLTGQGDESVAVAAMKNGASDYLVKDNLSGNDVAMAVVGAIKKAEFQRKLSDKQRELEDFAYTAAHDIKSPLATINQISQLMQLKSEEIKDDDISHYSESLIRVSKNIIVFVDELLAYAKSGREDRLLESVPVQMILDAALVNLSTMVEASNASVSFIGEPSRVQADKIALVQLFQNIIQNSLKYRHPDRPPVITVSSTTTGKFNEIVKILITDNGIGIQSSDHSRIFAPLVRLRTNPEIDGSGFGLAIARKIVDQHRGDIYVQSSSDQGTTIALLLQNENVLDD